MHFEARLRGSQPTIAPLAYLYDKSGVPYMYQQYAEVTSISPAAGSTAGGTVLTVSGRGFPDLSLGLGDRVTVLVGGAPCTVLTSSFSALTCRTAPQPAAPPAAATPLKGQYPGMRGAEYEFYDTLVPFYQLWRLNTTNITVGSSPTSTAYKAPLMDAMEALDYTRNGTCTRMKSMFTAPAAGAYRFYVQADDYAQLNGTWIQASGPRRLALPRLPPRTDHRPWEACQGRQCCGHWLQREGGWGLHTLCLHMARLHGIHLHHQRNPREACSVLGRPPLGPRAARSILNAPC